MEKLHADAGRGRESATTAVVFAATAASSGRGVQVASGSIDRFGERTGPWPARLPLQQQPDQVALQQRARRIERWIRYRTRHSGTRRRPRCSGFASCLSLWWQHRPGRRGSGSARIGSWCSLLMQPPPDRAAARPAPASEGAAEAGPPLQSPSAASIKGSRRSSAAVFAATRILFLLSNEVPKPKSTTHLSATQTNIFTFSQSERLLEIIISETSAADSSA